MKAYFRTSNCSDSSFEAPVNSGLCEMVADIVCEYKTVIFPERPSFQTLFSLYCTAVL